MIRTEILCDWRETPGARDPKARCYSIDNRPAPGGEAPDFDTAASKARNAASLAGWSRKSPTRSRARSGWICPVCNDREFG